MRLSNTVENKISLKTQFLRTTTRKQLGSCFREIQYQSRSFLTALGIKGILKALVPTSDSMVLISFHCQDADWMNRNLLLVWIMFSLSGFSPIISLKLIVFNIAIFYFSF